MILAKWFLVVPAKEKFATIVNSMDLVGSFDFQQCKSKLEDEMKIAKKLQQIGLRWPFNVRLCSRRWRRNWKLLD
jgi:hypothetical protein